MRITPRTIANNVRHLTNLSTGVSDSYLSLVVLTKLLCAGLSDKLRRQFNDDEEDDWRVLETTKAVVITKVDNFGRKWRACYEVAIDRIKDETTTNDDKEAAAALLFSDTSFQHEIDLMIADINKLRQGYENFRIKLLKRNPGVKSWEQVITGVGGIVMALVAVAVVLVHLVPGVAVGVVTQEIAAACFGIAAASTVVATIALTKDEVGRAMEFLGDISGKLLSLRTCMANLREAHGKGELQKGFPESCLPILELLVKRCNSVIEAATLL